MYISCIFHVVCAPFSALATRKTADAKADSNEIRLKLSEPQKTIHRLCPGIILNPNVSPLDIFFTVHIEVRRI